MPLSRIQSYSNSLSDDARWNLLLPSEPSLVTAVAGNTQATVSWTAPSFIGTPITNYSIQYSSNGGSSWTTFNKAASTSTSSVVTGLTNNVGYIFRAAAINAVGTGSYSTPSSLVITNIISSISGLQLWLDAADTSTLFDATTGGSLVAADGAVARWEDKSGNARHTTQSTGGNRPLRKTAIQNGLGVLRFDGSNDFVTCSIGSIRNCTVFVVLANKNQSIDSGEIDNIFAFGPFTNPPNNRGFALNSSNIFGSNTQRQLYDESLPTGSQTTRKNGNTSPVTLSLSEFCVASTVASGVSADLGSTFSVCRVWFQSDLNVYYGQNDIGEIIVYNSALSDADRSAVESHLMTKWGIS